MSALLTDAASQLKFEKGTNYTLLTVSLVLLAFFAMTVHEGVRDNDNDTNSALWAFALLVFLIGVAVMMLIPPFVVARTLKGNVKSTFGVLGISYVFILTALVSIGAALFDFEAANEIPNSSTLNTTLKTIGGVGLFFSLSSLSVAAVSLHNQKKS